MSAKAITFDLLDRQPAGSKFKGHELELAVRTKTGQIHYPSTMLRYVREYRKKTGRQIKCIDKAKSLYQVG